MSELLYKDESYKIIGACFEVHKELGNGFLEAVYQEALELEFKKQGIPYVRETQLQISYKGAILEKTYYADFVCYGNIIIELKALEKLTSNHESQVINYLKVTGNKLALLINFGQESLKYKRLVRI